MSLESFYGGKQGVSPVVKARFKYVDTNDPAYLKQIEKGFSADSLKSEVMDVCFADVSYEDVWYGQLAIIDTTNKRNPNNGKLFRRVLPRTESEVEENGTLCGEYIGRIVGPSEGYPKIRLGSVDNIKNQIDKDGNGSVSDKSIEYSFPTENGIVDTDNFDEVLPANLVANKENNQLISGFDENSIHYSWVNVRNNIDGEDQESCVYLGFQIPYTYFDFDFNAIDWRNDSLSHNWDNKTAYKNGSQPFYQKRTFGIPRGVKGNGVGFLTRTTFGKFINSGKEGATEILYDFKDLYEESTGKFDIKDYQGNYPQFEEDNLTENSAILVYTFYMYDFTYDNDNKTKIVTCYFGKITDIESIELDDDGSFRIKYSSGANEILNTLRWIKKTEMFSSKNNGIKDSIKVTYNTDEEKEFSPLRFLESLQIVSNTAQTEKILQARYTDEARATDVPGFNLFHIDGIAIDEDTKEIKYHTNPVNANLKPYLNQSKEEYKSFASPTFLNIVEEMFIGSDGHLYVKYSSSKYRYIGEADNEGEYYKPNIRYRHIEENGNVWYKGGDLPDSIGTSEEDWVWWQDLGIVKQTVSGVRIATDINIARHNAYREAIGELPLDWENLDVDDILNILNSSWDVDGKETNPYINGHIYLYQINEEANLNADPIEDRMGEIIFYKDKELSFFYDFQGQSDDVENKRGWKYAGPWSSSDASMQLKIKDGEEIIPNSERMHRKGFYFNVDSDKESEMELIDFWS